MNVFDLIRNMQGSGAGTMDAPKNPYHDEYDKFNSEYQSLLGQLKNEKDPIKRDQIINGIKQSHQKGLSLAQQMQDWDKKNNSNVKGGEEVNPDLAH